MTSATTTPPKRDDDVLQAVEDAAYRVSAIWNEYRALYEKQEDCDVVNAAASGAFRVIQICLMEMLGVSVCRLLDRARNAHQENASLALLLERRHALSPGDPRVADFARRLDALGVRGATLKRIRDKLIAHADFDVISNRAFPKEDLSTLRDLILDIGTFVEDYELAFKRTSISPIRHHGFRAGRDAARLVEVLREAPAVIAALAERKEE